MLPARGVETYRTLKYGSNVGGSQCINNSFYLCLATLHEVNGRINVDALINQGTSIAIDSSEIEYKPMSEIIDALLMRQVFRI